jgi:hypothetical protein
VYNHIFNTTGVAAKNLNRDFIGIELDDNYFDIAKLHLEQQGTELADVYPLLGSMRSIPFISKMWSENFFLLLLLQSLSSISLECFTPQ